MGLMKKLGHTFLLTENGRLAVEAVKAYWAAADNAAAVLTGITDTTKLPYRKFDICLMDISMPVMDGLEAAVAIRSFEAKNPRRGTLPIIACTAHNDTIMERNIYAAGMQNVVLKPIVKNELVAKMNALVDSCCTSILSPHCSHTSTPLPSTITTRFEAAAAQATVMLDVLRESEIKNGQGVSAGAALFSPPSNIEAFADRSLLSVLVGDMPSDCMHANDNICATEAVVTSRRVSIKETNRPNYSARKRPPPLPRSHSISKVRSLHSVLSPMDETRIEMSEPEAD